MGIRHSIMFKVNIARQRGGLPHIAEFNKGTSSHSQKQKCQVSVAKFQWELCFRDTTVVSLYYCSGLSVSLQVSE